MGPLVKMGEIAAGWDFVIAFIIGIFFGIVMEQAGFSSSKKITGWIYGYDFTVIRVFFTAAIVAMIGLVFMQYLGWINFDELFINPSYIWSILVGGALMGVGFAIGGFCPGTSVCAVAIGKIDAMFFVGGIILGVFFFAEAYPLFEALHRGKLSGAMGALKINETLGMSAGVFALVLIVVALAAFYVTSLIEKKVKKVDY